MNFVTHQLQTNVCRVLRTRKYLGRNMAQLRDKSLNMQLRG